jgi:hypothetical protein
MTAPLRVVVPHRVGNKLTSGGHFTLLGLFMFVLLEYLGVEIHGSG